MGSWEKFLSVFNKKSKSFLHMDVLCLKSYKNYILAGIGNQLFFFNGPNLVHIEVIFQDERIHDIYVNDKLIVVKGGRRCALIEIEIPNNVVHCNFISQVRCSDWIQDIIIMNDLIGLITSHNLFETWDIRFKKCLNSISCSEKCILYSCKIVGTSSEDVIVFSGTVFGEILIWSPFIKENELILQRCQGHNGAVFSVNINITKKIMTTTSDDRSFKVWSISSPGLLNSPLQWKNAEIHLVHCLFGHTARVWKNLIIDNFFVTVGEDSQLVIWGNDGRMFKTMSIHQEYGITAVCFSEGENSIITGGRDGGINSISWKFLTSPDNQLTESIIEIDSNFSPRVAFSEFGVVYTNRGGCSIMKEEKEVLYYNEKFVSYCLLEMSPDRTHIALGSITGYLVLINADTKKILVEERCGNGRIYSIHFVNKFIVICSENGEIGVWVYLEKIKLLKRFILPESKERWSTCCSLNENNLIVGDRMGNIFIYDMHANIEPIRSFIKIHCYLGVTDIVTLNDGTILSIGNDGTLKTYTKNLIHSSTQKLGMGCPWKIVKYKNDILVLGFRAAFFEIWSMLVGEVIARRKCGGSHRSCDYKIEGNNLFFLYTRKNKIFTVDISLDTIVRLRNGFHGKEIYFVKLICTDPVAVISGCEDTTLRTGKICKSDIEVAHVLTTHDSAVYDIAIVPEDNEKSVAVSVGAKSHMVIWKLNVCTYKFEELVHYNSGVSKGTQNWKTKDLCPKVRYTSVDMKRQDKGYLIVVGASDCFLRLFFYETNIKLLYSTPYTHCILKVTLLPIANKFFIVSSGTNGKIVFWSVDDSFTLSELESYCAHQSGVNCFELKEIDISKFLLATGGDDNKLCLSTVNFSEKQIKLNTIWENSSLHSSQLTGIKILTNIILTTSADQRVTVLRWSYKNEKVEIQYINQFLSMVPDIQGIDAKFSQNNKLSIILHGKGVELMEFDALSLGIVREDKEDDEK